MENQKDKTKIQRAEIIKKWEDAGFLNGLEKPLNKENLALLLDSPQKQKILTTAELLECEASKLLKMETLHLEELNTYLLMLAEMDNIGIRRKLVLLENFINKIKQNI